MCVTCTNGNDITNERATQDGDCIGQKVTKECTTQDEEEVILSSQQDDGDL